MWYYLNVYNKLDMYPYVYSSCTAINQKQICKQNARDAIKMINWAYATMSFSYPKYIE